MTAGTIITLVDSLMPNQYSDADKLRWLGTLDRQIYIETVNYHVDDVSDNDDTLDISLESTDVLLVPDVYGYDIYVPYLEARIDEANGEIAKYNNHMALYAAGYQAYRNWYNRYHQPYNYGGLRW